MNISNLIKACKTLTYEQATKKIENSGLELSLIRDMEFERLWRVENNPEVLYVSNCRKSLLTDMSDVRFIFA